MEAKLSSEVGPAGRLFKSSVDLFWALLQRTSTLKFEQSQKNALRDEFGRFYFWGDGYYPFDGRLDEILLSSSRLRYRVLSILAEVGDILCNEKTGLFALVNRSFGDARLKHQRSEVHNLIEVIRESLDEPVSSGSDSDSDYSEAGDLFGEIINDLRSRNRCLIDLSASLDRPAPDADNLEKGAPVAAPFKVSGPAEAWARKILDTYQNIDITLAGRLGEANWQRYQRISKKLENMKALSSDDEEDETDELGDLPIFSETTKSTKDRSSIFSDLSAKSSHFSPTATSTSQSDFDYSFPMARKRALSKDARSQATYTSRVTDDQGERGWLRIPALPIKTEELGKAFRCTICGEKLQEIMDRTDWKRHVFADLEPYVCTFSECEGGIASFQSRKAWADHEFTVHRITKSWGCNECPATFDDKNLFRQHLRGSHGYIRLTDTQLEGLVSAAERRTATISEGATCPFCPEYPGATSRAFAMHVARHMEEIALAVLPRDSDYEAEHSSVSSSHSLPAMIDDADAQGGFINTGQEPEPPGGPALQKEPSKRVGLDQFYFLAVLGNGSFGKVCLAEAKISKKLYAIKIVKKEFIIENDEVERVRTEKNAFLMVAKARHPFVVDLIATFQTETRLYYVMEYVSGGNLMVHVRRGQFGVKRSQFYAAEMCLALKFFHENGIIYRDLKLDNVLLTLDGHIKIMGFDRCKEGMWSGVTTKSFTGTPEYMAPEILLDEPYGRAVDWWAFGVVLYQMLLQDSPFRGEDEDEIYDAILADEPLYPTHMPRDCVSIIQKLLTREPELRLGSGPNDAVEVMQHGFFRNVNWDDIYHKKVFPPFLPIVSNQTDTSNFDPEFTNLTPALTPLHSSVLSEAMQEEFRGFSFCNVEI